MENKIVVATPAWWDLTAVEKNLLSTVVAVNKRCTTIDIPVFLPLKSPKVRLFSLSFEQMSRTGLYQLLFFRLHFVWYVVV